MLKPMTVPDAAMALGVKAHLIQNLFRRHVLPEPPRIGMNRLIGPAEFRAIEKALRAAGRLETQGAGA